MRSIIVPGPPADGSGQQVAQYARAIREALQVAMRTNLIIHLPMYREPGLDEKLFTQNGIGEAENHVSEIDVFTAWDTWHTIRSVCNYNSRLFVGKQLWPHTRDAPRR